VKKLQRGRADPNESAAQAESFAAEPAAAGEGPENVSALQLLDRLTYELAAQGIPASGTSALRRRVVEMEELQEQARTALEQLNQAVEKLRAPAPRLGTLMQELPNGRALVCASGAEYICNLDPAVPEAPLETGVRVLLNEAFAVTDVFGFEKNGPVVRVTELLPDGRLRVGNEAGISDAVVVRSSLLAKEKLKLGLDVRLDTQHRVAVEVLGGAKRFDWAFSRVEPIPWQAIGGQQEAVQSIRDCIELPFLHAHLFQRFQPDRDKTEARFGVAPATSSNKKAISTNRQRKKSKL
jgi:proteasome-associated ATPase